MIAVKIRAATHGFLDKVAVGTFLAKSLQTRASRTSSHESEARGSDSTKQNKLTENETTLKNTLRKSSRELSSGERPPWMQRNCLFITAASGSVLKEARQAS